MGAGNFAVYTNFKAKDGVSPTFKNMTRGANSFQSRLDKLNYSARGVGSSMQSTFQKIDALINASIAFFAVNAINTTLKGFVDKASDLQETISKTTQVFKTNTSEVLNWSQNSIKTMGLAEQTSLDTASLYGDMATGMGLATKRAAQMSMGLTQLGADLSSFKNINQDTAKTALAGVFTGETESLKQLGIIMTEANLQEFARSKGIKKKIQDMKQAEKVELRYQYILNQTKNAQGDFNRTIGGFANQQRINQEKLKQMYTNFGKYMLPTYTKLMVLFNKSLEKYSPQIEAIFGKTFNSIVQTAKAVKPVLDKLGKSFKYLSKHLAPELAGLAPIFKFLFEGVLVPGLVLSIDTLNKLFVAIDKTYNFIKSNWSKVTTVLIGVAGAFLAINRAQIAMSAQTIISTGLINFEIIAFKGMYFWEGLCALRTWNLTAAQSAFNTALGFSVSSLGFFVLAVGAAAAGAALGMELYNKWLPFRKLIDSLVWNIDKLKSLWGGGVGVDINKNTLRGSGTQNLEYNQIEGRYTPKWGHENEYYLKNGYYIPKVPTYMIGGSKNGVQPKTSGAPRLVNNQLTPKISGASGVVEIKQTIENKNNSRISSSFNLTGAHNLNLVPSY